MTKIAPISKSFPKITIVTPSYNQAAYLEQTLKSVLDQCYPNLEYIVMDGGSADGSVEIIRRYADRLAHWESHKDNGQADAIYRGFERATGEIFGFVNSDDLLLPGALLKVSNYFLKNPQKKWAVGGSILINSNGEPLKDRFSNIACNYGGNISFNELLYWRCRFNQPSVFWRSKLFKDCGGFDRSLTFCFDYDMFLRFAQIISSGHIRSFLSAFRVHSNSKTSTLHDIRMSEDHLLWTRYNKYKKNKYHIRIMSMFYALRHKLASRLMQMKLLVRFIRIPYGNA